MSKTFVKVTNEDVYQEIKLLREDFGLLREDFNKTKSKVKINTWCSTTALSLVAGIIIGMILK